MSVTFNSTRFAQARHFTQPSAVTFSSSRVPRPKPESFIVALAERMENKTPYSPIGRWFMSGVFGVLAAVTLGLQHHPATAPNPAREKKFLAIATQLCQKAETPLEKATACSAQVKQPGRIRSTLYRASPAGQIRNGLLALGLVGGSAFYLLPELLRLGRVRLGRKNKPTQ